MRCGGSSRERRVPTRTMDGRANIGRAPSGVPGAGQLSTELPESAGASWQGTAAGEALPSPSAVVQASATARKGVSKAGAGVFEGAGAGLGLLSDSCRAESDDVQSCCTTVN
jgi:hypothetical protein